jgi:alanyl-tRNA synthetase
VEQKGSLVKADALRFDFSHFSKMSSDELDAVEQQVNAKILANHPLVEHRALSLEDAKASGAMMLFGEKYGDVVRMIEFDSSKELCGGTHAPATGALGLFRITQETAVASGIRRIEAITGSAALASVKEEKQTLEALRQLLKAPANLNKAVEDMQLKLATLQKEMDAIKQKEAAAAKSDLASNLEEINGVNTFIGELPLDAGAIKDIAFQLKNERAPFFGVFGSQTGGKVTLTVAISDDLIAERGLNAGAIVRELAQHIQGGGGGQAFFATAGGKKADGIPAALDQAKGIL